MSALIGIGMTAVGSVADAVGYVIQKKGHQSVIDKREISDIYEDDENHSILTNKIWIAGFSTTIFGSVLNALALNYAAQSLLAPLRSITLVANAILAAAFLGEPFDIQKRFGILLVVIGSVAAVVFGPRSSDDELTIKSLKSNWQNMEFIVFFSSLAGFTVIDFLFVKVYEGRNKRATVAKHNAAKKKTSGGGAEDETTDAEDEVTVMEVIYGGNFLMVSYCWLAAWFGSVNMLFMKSFVTILSDFNADVVADYFFYLTIVVVIGVNVGLEIFRQRALLYFDASFVVPLFQVALVLGSSIMGAVFFGEFQLLTTTYLILFAASIGITVVGVAILAYDVGAVYNKVLTTVGLKEEKELSEAEKSKKAFQSGRSVGALSLTGLDPEPLDIQKAKLKRTKENIGPAVMRGFAADVMAFFTAKRGNQARTPKMRQTLSLGDIDDHKDDEESTSRPPISMAQSMPVHSLSSKKAAGDTGDANGDTTKPSPEIKVVVNGQDPPQNGNTESTDSKPAMRSIESVQSQSPSSDSHILNDTDSGMIFVANANESGTATLKDQGSEIVFKE